MRRIRYHVAASLDGYIAGPREEIDWIVTDPEVEFSALFAQFDTALMGRRTYETMKRLGGPPMPGLKIVVLSRTLRARDHEDVVVIGVDAAGAVAAMRAEPGRDIWLFGGGEVFRFLLGAGLVDGVEVAVMPVLLGGGVPLLASMDAWTHLDLTGHRLYPTGIVLLEYAVASASTGEGSPRGSPRSSSSRSGAGRRPRRQPENG